MFFFSLVYQQSLCNDCVADGSGSGSGSGSETGTETETETGTAGVDAGPCGFGTGKNGIDDEEVDVVQIDDDLVG